MTYGVASCASCAFSSGLGRSGALKKASCVQMVSDPQKALCIVCGTGSAGLRHLQLIHNATDVRLAALPIRPERRQELASLGVPVMECWGQAALLGATQAIISTEPCRHGASVIDSLHAGSSIHC